MVDEDDTVLMDYLSGLLSPQVQRTVEGEHLNSCSVEPQACLKVNVGGKFLLIPLSDLAGMQAICGPLVASSNGHWLDDRYSERVLLDLTEELNIAKVQYDQTSWQGHSLKLKQTLQSVLVDLIIGPVHSTNEQQWRCFEGVRYTLVIE